MKGIYFQKEKPEIKPLPHTNPETPLVPEIKPSPEKTEPPPKLPETAPDHQPEIVPGPDKQN